MNITVKVVPNAKKVLIKEENGLLKVYVSASAVEGKANERLIEVLADHFHVRQSAIMITKGLKSRVKNISINGI